MGNKAYRLFQVEIRDNRRRKLPAGVLMQGMEPIDYIEHLLRSMLNRTILDKPHLLMPIPQNPPKPQANDPCFRLSAVERDSMQPILQVQMAYGRYGEKDSLIDPQGKASFIGDDAAVDNYTLRLAFTDDPNEFHIVSPMKGRGHGAIHLLNYLAYADRCAHEPNQEPWYKYVHSGEVDRNRLNSISQNGSIQAVTLKMQSLGASGNRTQNPVTLRMETKTTTAKRTAKNLLSSWFHRSKTLSGQGCAHDIQQAFSQDLYADPNSIWDDAGIVIEENGKSTTITAKTIDTLFIYPLDANADMDDLWADAAVKLTDIGLRAGRIIPNVTTFRP